MLISGELEEVLPLEDADALEKANPITASGDMRLDLEKIKARDEALVKMAMKDEPLAVIVLGGSHDLSASIRRVGRVECEYLRVTTKRFKEILEQRVAEARKQ